MPERLRIALPEIRPEAVFNNSPHPAFPITLQTAHTIIFTISHPTFPFTHLAPLLTAWHASVELIPARGRAQIHAAVAAAIAAAAATAAASPAAAAAAAVLPPMVSTAGPPPPSPPPPPPSPSPTPPRHQWSHCFWRRTRCRCRQYLMAFCRAWAEWSRCRRRCSLRAWHRLGRLGRRPVDMDVWRHIILSL